jgi:thiamine biosynthesis lipoprotein ApbE
VTGTSVLGTAVDAGPPGQPPAGSAVQRPIAGPERFGSASWRALGTGVRLVCTDPAGLDLARPAVERELAAIDLAASRFRADSEVSRLAAAGGRAVAVSPLLAAAIGAALRAARLTGGAVDPTVGGALADLGYDRDFAQLRAGSARVTVRQVPGWRSVELDPAAGTARVPAGTMIDLGATAKAFTADRAARFAAAAGGCGVLVSLGGDVAVAGTAPAGGWQVRVTDDHADTAGGQRVTINSGGLATSSTTVRRWHRAGRDLHHLLDPATCAPVDGPWRTVSVAAGSCLDANVASTATIVLADSGLSWLAGTGLPGRLVSHSGTVHRVGDWPREDG